MKCFFRNATSPARLQAHIKATAAPVRHYKVFPLTASIPVPQVVGACYFAPWLHSTLHDGPFFSLLQLLSAAGLFTWPQVTDSQLHVWPLETDKASLHPPNWRLYHSAVCLSMCVCVAGRECVAITSGPNTRLRPALSVYNGSDQSRPSVQPVSGPAVWL